MARKTNDLDKSSKNEIDSKKIHTKLETKKIPASVKTIIKTDNPDFSVSELTALRLKRLALILLFHFFYYFI